MKLEARARSALSRLGGAFVENLGLKVLSFAGALGLYAFVHSAQDAERALLLDVVAMSPPDGAHRVLLTPLPPVVRVTVRGPRTILDEMKADDLGPVQLDLRSGKLDHVDIDPSAIHLPPGVHAEQVDPPSIPLRWEDSITREVPVQASITGQPAPGFVVKGAPKVEPLLVRTAGPRSVVEVLQFARAEAFDVTGLAKEGSYERTLPLDRPPLRATFETQTVAVRVDVAREEFQRIFVKVPVLALGVSSARVTPSEVDVRVEGPPDLVRSLRPEQIVATVDPRSSGLNAQGTGSAKLPVMVELEGCRATAQPQAVVVRW